MKFTIAIPTRNRALLLPNALKSALDQDFQDYEIVVSNNCSEDETESAILQFSDPKVRYIKTDRPMSMVDHWNFVFEHIKGDWVIYLCDDDALTAFTLPIVNQMIEATPGIEIFHIYNKSHYAYGHVNELWKNRSIRNCIIYHPPSRNAIEFYNAQNVLKRTWRNLDMDYPKPHNSFVHRSLLEKIRRKYKRVFHPWAPDLSSGLLFLDNIQIYAYIKKPLLICGRNYASYGAGSMVNPAKLKEYFSEYEEFNGSFDFSPYPDLYTITNAVFDMQCRLGEVIDINLKNLEINPYVFRRLLLEEVKVYLDCGYEEYREYYNLISNDIKQYKKPFSETRLGQISNRAKGIIPRLKNGRPRLIQGDNSVQPFTNIYEATLYIAKFYNK